MFTINVVLFGIGILALILQIVITTKKEWFAFLFYGAVAAIFWQLIVNFPWLGEIVIGVLELILKLFPWIIGVGVAFGILMLILIVRVGIIHDKRHPSSVAFWLMTEGKYDEAEELLKKAMTESYKYSEEEISNIQRQLRAFRMYKEGKSKPETAETLTKLLPAQSIKGLLPANPTLS